MMLRMIRPFPKRARLSYVSDVSIKQSFGDDGPGVDVNIGNYNGKDAVVPNPIERLQKEMEVNLIPSSDLVFVSSISEAAMSRKLLTQKKFISVEEGYKHSKLMPESSLPEIAVFGRSNVGKSSLLQQIFGNNPALRKVSVSKRPGHTKKMRRILLGEQCALVDLPGYGDNEPAAFGRHVVPFITSRHNLSHILMLVDGATGLVEEDLGAFELLETSSKPYSIVINKIDLAPPSSLIRQVMQVVSLKEKYRFVLAFPQPFLTSCHTGEGILLLQSYICHLAGLVQPNANK